MNVSLRFWLLSRKEALRSLDITVQHNHTKKMAGRIFFLILATVKITAVAARVFICYL